MTDIFISYKHEDLDRVDLIRQSLERAGFTVWWDDHLTPRGAWDALIEKAISDAACVLVLWSAKAVNSEWVRLEAHHAREHNKLVPVKIERCDVPFAFQLTQSIDLSEWTGDPDDRFWRKLLVWLADLKAPRQENLVGQPFANPFREVIGHTEAGEPIVDGALVNAATPPATLYRDGDDSPVMRVLPTGSYLMGASAGDPDHKRSELPQRRVQIHHAIAVSLYPLLTWQYRRLMEASAVVAMPVKGRRWFGSPSPPPTPEQKVSRDDCPVNCVSWLEATEYCRRLSADRGAVFRLPTEAEWEYACRAGSGARFGWGDRIDSAKACFGKLDLDGPVTPGKFEANRFGLYDMQGNVREWTQDRWHENYDGAPGDGAAWVTGHSAMRVTRGGAWSDSGDLPARIGAGSRH